jgi:putative SOS response-associated peptidase YedK
MCGRYTRTSPIQSYATLFDFPTPAEAPAPRYNIAPTQPVLAVRQREGDAHREMAWLKWGLIPHWAGDPKIAYRTINARSETAAKSPAFRDAFKRRRCLLPADGFFEWRKDGKKKLPYYFQTKDHQPFALAGLWETWKDGDGKPLETCTILTTDANALVSEFHDRMPVILPPEDWERWLDPAQHDPAEVQPMLAPYKAELMTATAVNPIVNSGKVDSPTCIEPIESVA